MAETDTELERLKGYFEAAKRQTPDLPEALAARMLADAATVQAARADRVSAREFAPRPGLLRQMIDALGGWPVVAGLAAACAAGVWLGFAPPAFLPDPAGLVVQSQAGQDLSYGDDLEAMLAEDG